MCIFLSVIFWLRTAAFDRSTIAKIQKETIYFFDHFQAGASVARVFFQGVAASTSGRYNFPRFSGDLEPLTEPSDCTVELAGGGCRKWSGASRMFHATYQSQRSRKSKKCKKAEPINRLPKSEGATEMAGGARKRCSERLHKYDNNLDCYLFIEPTNMQYGPDPSPTEYYTAKCILFSAAVNGKLGEKLCAKHAGCGQNWYS